MLNIALKVTQFSRCALKYLKMSVVDATYIKKLKIHFSSQTLKRNPSFDDVISKTFHKNCD